MDLQKFRHVLTVDCGLTLDRVVVLGFSGGPDSLALLSLLHDFGMPVVATHFDHSLRPGSALDVAVAAELAASLGARFETTRGDVAAEASQHGWSIEEAARNLRYDFLFAAAESEGAQAVLVAHNADDQAETVLMHLLRGAGPAGLRGMQLRGLPNPWSASIPLARPLLTTWRSEIESYLQAKGLQPILDPSNQETAFFRNKLRLEALPYLEELAPGFRARLNQTAGIISADQVLIEALAAEAWRRCLAARDANFVRFDRAALQVEPLALQRAVLRKAAAELQPDIRDVDYAAVERALGAIKRGLPGKQDWLGDLSILVEPANVWIASSEAELPADWPQAPEHMLSIDPPASMELGGWRLTATETPVDTSASVPTDPFQAWLDMRANNGKLTVRRRHDGDRFQPLGLEQGSQKLSDFFVNEKVPVRARAAWPLVTLGDEIVWVPGYRLAHPYRLRPDTKHALRLALVRL